MIKIFGNPIFLAIFGPILAAAVLLIITKAWKYIKKEYERSKNASHDYASSYKNRHGKLTATCVGLIDSMSLDDIFVDVKFLEQKRESKNGTLEDIENGFRAKSNMIFSSSSDERQDAMRVAYDEKYLIVLGGPGVGKSTFLRKVGLEALKGKNGNFEQEWIPVFFEMKNFTSDQIDIESLIIEELKNCRFPYPEEMAKTALKSGNLLILFDGLDEVPKENVGKVIHKIRNFVNLYSQNRFIASSRTAAYKDGFRNFTKVEIAEFDDSQIKRYINNYFETLSNLYLRRIADSTTTADKCWKMLNLHENRAIKELMRNPLLLTLLCVVYVEFKEFPRNRAELYEKALNIFLQEWQNEKFEGQDSPVSGCLDILEIERLLYEIAAKNFEQNRFLFSEKELIDQIKGFCERNSISISTRDVRKTLNSIVVEQGFFVEQANGVYSFLHLTFQEYLTANYFVETQTIQNLVSKYVHDDQWREVFLLTAGKMSKADNLLVEITNEAVKSLDNDGIKLLFEWAKRITNISDDDYNVRFKRIFAIRHFISLYLLNKIYEHINNITNQNTHSKLGFSRYPDFKQDLELYVDLHRNLSAADIDFQLNLHEDPLLDPDRAIQFYEDLYSNFDGDLKLFLKYYLDYRLKFSNHFIYNRDIEFIFFPYRDLNLYQDFYQYMDIDFYLYNSIKYGVRFEKELEQRINLVERIQQENLFRNIDLQLIVQRFRSQQKLIKDAREKKTVKPIGASIHNTWLSVLQITDDMLTISCKEIQGYIHFLRAIQLIFACERAATSVSPDVLTKCIERLLTREMGEIGEEK